MNLFSFIGWSGSGKTTIITLLIKELKSRGFNIASIKHVPGKFYLEPESKDSFKYLANGAAEAFILSSKELVNTMLIDENFNIFDKYKKKFDQYDIVFAEGLSYGNYPVLEVFDSTKNNSLKGDPKKITAIIGDKNIFEGINFFERDDIVRIAYFIERLSKT